MNLIQTVPWTKLNADGIWGHVSVKYMEPPGRLCHNMDHVVGIYKYASELQIPYDINLDVAILFHDIVYDSGKDKEIRSAYEFTNVVKNFQNGNMKILPEKVLFPFGVVDVGVVLDSILGTINHAPEGDDETPINQMILLDLYGFAKDKDRKCNFVNLMNEIDHLYSDLNATREQVYNNVRENLLRLYGNITYFITFNVKNGINIKYKTEWEAILTGIEKQVAEIDAILKLDTELKEKGSK